VILFHLSTDSFMTSFKSGVANKLESEFAKLDQTH